MSSGVKIQFWYNLCYMPTDDLTFSFFQSLETRLSEMDSKLDRKFDGVDRKFETMETRLDGVGESMAHQTAVLTQQAKDIEHHIKRTDLLEAAMLATEKTAKTTKTLALGISGIALVIALTAMGLGPQVALMLKLLLPLILG